MAKGLCTAAWYAKEGFDFNAIRDKACIQTATTALLLYNTNPETQYWTQEEPPVRPHLAEAWRREATQRLPFTDPAQRSLRVELAKISEARGWHGALVLGAPTYRPKTNVLHPTTAIAGPACAALADLEYTIMDANTVATLEPPSSAQEHHPRRRRLITILPKELYQGLVDVIWRHQTDCLGDWTMDGGRLDSYTRWSKSRKHLGLSLPERPPPWWTEIAKHLMATPENPHTDVLKEDIWTQQALPAQGQFVVQPVQNRGGQYTNHFVYKVTNTRLHPETSAPEAYLEWWDFPAGHPRRRARPGTVCRDPGFTKQPWLQDGNLIEDGNDDRWIPYEDVYPIDHHEPPGTVEIFLSLSDDTRDMAYYRHRARHRDQARRTADFQRQSLPSTDPRLIEREWEGGQDPSPFSGSDGSHHQTQGRTGYGCCLQVGETWHTTQGQLSTYRDDAAATAYSSTSGELAGYAATLRTVRKHSHPTTTAHPSTTHTSLTLPEP